MKIAVISFDYWGYDGKIVEELITQGHEATHIKLSDFKYRYKNSFEKISNFISKTFLGKNVKKIKAEDFVLNTLKSSSQFDYILAINPERISKQTHRVIKKHTKQYIAYLYDSLERHNAKSLLHDIFDKIYSFDKKDAKQFNLNFLPNYIHLKKRNTLLVPKNKIFSISSIDDRYTTINKFVAYFDANSIKHETIFYDKKRPKKILESVIFTKNKLNQSQIQDKIENATIVLDVLRKNQTGISFRIFDALALEKKIITTNKSIKDFDFYNPNNILIVDKENITIPIDFLTSEYTKLPENILKNYTLENWIKTIINEK